MKALFYTISLMLLYGCSPKICEFFTYNKYISNYEIHIINDSLNLYFKTPGDIHYVTNKKDLKKVVKNTRYKLPKKVLAYGITDEPPYEFFVTISNREKFKLSNDLVTYDTLVSNQIIKFIGNSLSSYSRETLETDLYNIFKTIEIGPSYRKNIISIFDIVDKYRSSNKFYSALREIREFPTYDKHEEWTKLQLELTFSSFLGSNEYYESYLSIIESKFNKNDSISKVILNNSVHNSYVLDTIVEKAKNHIIIMINENHYYPNHRLLVTELLPKLKEIGYTHLALEALGKCQDSILNLPNTYPTLKSGFYTSEQNFANLIRKAKELNFKFVAYENYYEDKNREFTQAENLYNKTFLVDPNCKVVVLAGIDHILEKSINGKERMASIFKNKYNIDPLTLSQTHLNNYRKIIDNKYAIIDSDFFDNSNFPAVDYLVLNNNMNNVYENFPALFNFKNNSENDVQVLLFYGDEIENKYDFMRRVPYYTSIIKSKTSLYLPLDNKHETHLYTLDINGNFVENQIFNAVDDIFDK